MQHKNILIVLAIATYCTTRTTEYNADHVYAVILAGGSGERLWPYSNQKRPKQLLHIAQQGTLLEQAINRFATSIPHERIWISTTEKFKSIINETCGSHVGAIIAEPAPQNTAPSILLSCLSIAAQDPQATIIFAPADPFIPEQESKVFVESIQKTIIFAQKHNCIALLGVKPTSPATGYGYIEHTPATDNGSNLLQVLRFHEKPSLEKAIEYCSSTTMLWNIGMFCGTATAFIEAFKKHVPTIFEAVTAFVEGHGMYTAAPAISIDYAIMEKSEKIFVLPISLTWYDVGNLHTFLSLKKQFDGENTRIISVQSKDNLVDAPDLVVALVGLDNLCITKQQNVLVIAKKESTEQIRDVVRYLKKNNEQTLL